LKIYFSLFVKGVYNSIIFILELWFVELFILTLAFIVEVLVNIMYIIKALLNPKTKEFRIFFIYTSIMLVSLFNGLFISIILSFFIKMSAYFWSLLIGVYIYLTLCYLNSKFHPEYYSGLKPNKKYPSILEFIIEGLNYFKIRINQVNLYKNITWYDVYIYFSSFTLKDFKRFFSLIYEWHMYYYQEIVPQFDWVEFWRQYYYRKILEYGININDTEKELSVNVELDFCQAIGFIINYFHLITFINFFIQFLLFLVYIIYYPKKFYCLFHIYLFSFLRYVLIFRSFFYFFSSYYFFCLFY
jgi:hypothetical protein